MADIPQRVLRTRAPSFAQVLLVFVLLGAAITTVTALLAMQDRLATFRERALSEAVAARAAGARLTLGRALYQDWRRAQTIADQLRGRSISELRSALDLAVGERDRVFWAGLASTDGTVLVASGRVLEGRNVAAMPWFRQGLRGPFAGDVRDAVLHRDEPGPDGPRRFLDLATPVLGPDGQVEAVLGMQLNYSWAQKFLAETAATMGLHVFLVNGQGMVVMATDEAATERLDLPSMRSASAGAATVSFETWPDGNRYFTAVLPQVSYGDLPSFGWSMVARIGSDVLIRPMHALQQSVVSTLALAGALLLALTGVFIWAYVSPFARLAESASVIAGGSDEYPYESRRTIELARLSAALARLQGLARARRRVVSDGSKTTGAAPDPR